MAPGALRIHGMCGDSTLFKSSMENGLGCRWVQPGAAGYSWAKKPPGARSHPWRALLPGLPPKKRDPKKHMKSCPYPIKSSETRYIYKYHGQDKKTTGAPPEHCRTCPISNSMWGSDDLSSKRDHNKIPIRFIRNPAENQKCEAK